MPLLIAAVLAALLSAASPAAAQTRVVFGLSSEGFLTVPFYIAQTKGFFEREGIKAETVKLQGGPVTAAAGLAGDVNVMTALSIATVIQARVANQDVRAFAAMVGELATALVIQGDMYAKAGLSEATPLKDRLKLLKGLTIGVTGAGSSTDKLARFLSTTAGYQPDRDVTIVPVGSASAILASFARKRIDSFILSSPTPEAAEIENGGKILVNFGKGEVPELRHFLYSLLAARSDWMKANPDTVRRIVRAIAAAEAFLHANPAEAMATMQPFFKSTDPRVLEAAFNNNLPAYSKTPRIDPSGIESALAFAETTEGKRPPVKAEDVYTNEYLTP